MKKAYENWTKKMMESWKNLEGAKTANLFSKDVEYYETLDTAPCKTFQEVVDLWKIVPENQSKIEYNFSVIACDENCGIINWIMNRTISTSSGEVNQYIDGIFQIKLDSEQKCCYFKQWRFTKENM